MSRPLSSLQQHKRCGVNTSRNLLQSGLGGRGHPNLQSQANLHRVMAQTLLGAGLKALVQARQ